MPNLVSTNGWDQLFLIVATNTKNGKAEVIDEFDDEDEAQKEACGYAEAYGPGWAIKIMRNE